MSAKQSSRLTLIPALLLGALILSCGGPSGRIKADDEADLVGADRAGSAAYHEVIAEGVERLLQSHSATTKGERWSLACLGFENAGLEELVDWEEQLYELITGAVTRSGRYKVVSRRFLEAGMKEASVRQDELFLPKHQRSLAAALERANQPVQLFLFPKLTTGTTRAGNKKQRDYLLTLELVEVETGWSDKFVGKVSKEYTR